MSGDLRAAVEGEMAHERHLRERTYSLYCVGCGTWPPPEGAVLVTEETLAAALHGECPRHAGSIVPHTNDFGAGYWPCRQRAAAILRHLREGT